MRQGCPFFSYQLRSAWPAALRDQVHREDELRERDCHFFGDPPLWNLFVRHLGNGIPGFVDLFQEAVHFVFVQNDFRPKGRAVAKC